MSERLEDLMQELLLCGYPGTMDDAVAKAKQDIRDFFSETIRDRDTWKEAAEVRADAERRLNEAVRERATWKEAAEARATAEDNLRAARASLREWIAANAPGGWIDGLRVYAVQCTEALRAIRAEAFPFTAAGGLPMQRIVRLTEVAFEQNPAQSTTERSASAQYDREAGSTCTPGVATRVQGSADFQRTPHGSEGSASPLHPSESFPNPLTDSDVVGAADKAYWDARFAGKSYADAEAAAVASVTPAIDHSPKEA